MIAIGAAGRAAFRGDREMTGGQNFFEIAS
jgi:hypothetical protein